jgi:DNA polymerase III alpha subunit (gram-positive type)
MLNLVTIGNIKPNITVQIKGVIKDSTCNILHNGNRVIIFIVEDYTDEITCKYFAISDEQIHLSNLLIKGKRVNLIGKSLWDGYYDKLTYIVESVHTC